MENKAQIAISADFLTAFSRLPRTIQGKTTEFLSKFRLNPRSPGINYEKVKGTDSRLYSVRIDKEYRAIILRQDETGTYLLLWVDIHDKAYDWANSRKCVINPMTGAIQVYAVRRVNAVVPQKAEIEVPPLFASLADTSLIELGVPMDQISFVKSLKDKADFLKAKDDLPRDVFENLTWIMEGIPLKEVLEMAHKEKTAEKPDEDLGKALERAETQKSFVVVKGEEELRRIMAEPLEAWRVFLHPSQRRLVKKNFHGPARVLGGAGTGKTVVAMHRAKALADYCHDNERVLFTTFTVNLARDIKENLKKICTTEELRKIDVINLDAWTRRFLREQGYKPQIGYGENDTLNKIWDSVYKIADDDLGLGKDFYKEEWRRVVVGEEAFTKAAYAMAPRKGRGVRLNRMKRVKIWNVFEAYMNKMKEKDIRDIDYVYYEGRKLIESKGLSPVYKNIIVDEGQDLSPSAFRLLRAIAGEVHDNDIFIVGDAHQRIYSNHAVLSKCGIDIRGRGNLLKINYRTTEEIRKYAFALLQGIPFDDLDTDLDVGDNCRSLTHGKAPIIQNFKSANQEMDYVFEEIRRLHKEGVPYRSMCIVSRTHKVIDNYKAALENVGIPVQEILLNDSSIESKDMLRIATMHRVKGLEFEYIFVVNCNNNILPLSTALDEAKDDVSREEVMTAEKCLLYVALTRARQGAYITSNGKPSPFIKASEK